MSECRVACKKNQDQFHFVELDTTWHFFNMYNNYFLGDAMRRYGIDCKGWIINRCVRQQWPTSVTATVVKSTANDDDDETTSRPRRLFDMSTVVRFFFFFPPSAILKKKQLPIKTQSSCFWHDAVDLTHFVTTVLIIIWWCTIYNYMRATKVIVFVL